MKKRGLFLITLISFLLTGCNSIPYSPKKLDPNVTYSDVYLIMGQSNATGCASYSFLETSHPDIYQKYINGNNKVLITYDTYYQLEESFIPTKLGCSDNGDFFGPEVGMAEVFSEKEATSYIIKATISGSCLQTEYVTPQGYVRYDYNRCVSFIQKQLKLLEDKGLNPRIRGIFWMQGESDAFFEGAEKYEKSMVYFYKYLRHDLNDYVYEYFNFVDAYISTRTLWTYADVVNRCKDNVSKQFDDYYVIKTNGEDENAINLILKPESHEDDNDPAHYDSSSILLLGQTAAKYLLK